MIKRTCFIFISDSNKFLIHCTRTKGKALKVVANGKRTVTSNSMINLSIHFCKHTKNVEQLARDTNKSSPVIKSKFETHQIYNFSFGSMH